MENCVDALAGHPALAKRFARSEEQLEKIRRAFSSSKFLADLPVAVFCAGSVARRELGTKSDMDVFVMADAEIGRPSRLREFTLFAEVIDVNKSLDLPPFSNDGQYLKIYPLEEIKTLAGSSKDDS